MQEWTRLLLDVLVELAGCLGPNRFEDGLASPMGGLRAHQDPNLVEPLPLTVEGEQAADLEVPGRDVERLRDARPLSRYRTPVQPETLLSTMKCSRPLESVVVTFWCAAECTRGWSGLQR